jgi:hypothetical protein
MSFTTEISLTHHKLYLTRGTQKLHFTFNIDWDGRSITFEGEGLKIKYTDTPDLVWNSRGLIDRGIEHLKEVAEQLPSASIKIKLPHSDTLQSLDEAFNKNCAITEYLNQQQKENNDNYVKLMRKKWWLLHPDIVEISYRPRYETDYGHSEWETYPDISWKSIIDVQGKNVLWAYNPIITNHYPALESEITDEETVITVRNPYLT